ncbi:DUF4129 domain-containing protein [Chitinilyticum piscinae]|uniref:DUF4129 domain-containing protein n=1 Tax=Chitinilyticum piscinae TaxID=2866724 RepID=A0A8J7K890_9NEIS|nr:DUF4129 domain-containing protein [Chitinilyticum piscinae]MBE9609163.1 DUF4129 domain-containing protein [Chitinilyticum piscinae]
MKLEQLQVDARPRPHAQAIDLGMALLREHARTVYLCWWALWLPLGLIVALLSPHGFLSWNWVILWWLRPLIERSTIFILSRGVFGETISVRQALRAWPRLLRKGWIRTLTWWRPIVTGRGLYQPVWVLEGADGAQATQRRRVLGARGAYGSAAWFGIICAHFEFVLQLALLSLLGLFFSSVDEMNPFLLLQDEFAPGRWENHLPLVGYLISAGLIGPYYAASCFTLYLNRRAELEGWDIEIALRRLLRRRQSLLDRGAAKSMLGLLVAGFCLVLPAPDSQAADCSKLPVPGDTAASRASAVSAQQRQLRASIDSLSRGQEFSHWECVTKWEAKTKVPEKIDTDEESWLSKLFRTRAPDLPVAEILKPLVITLAIALIVWLLWRNRRLLGGLLPAARDPERQIASEIAGLDIRPESLPGDIPTSVLQLWQRGQRREALALLYRASVSRLAHADSLEIAPGFTEGDCLQSARQAERQGLLSQPAGVLFAEITRAWQAAAYADRWPQDEQLRNLCLRWPPALGGQS